MFHISRAAAPSLKPLNIVCFGLYLLEEGKASWKQIMGLSKRRNKIELNLEFVRNFEEATAEVHFLFYLEKRLLVASLK
jgi:hypothetical protein